MNPIVKRILSSLAAAAIPLLEAQAIAYYTQHSQDLPRKAEQAKAWMRARYAEYQARIPLLAASPLDELLVESALNEAWERLDDRVKQAARDVRASLPAPASTAPAVWPHPPTGVALGPEYFEAEATAKKPE